MKVVKKTEVLTNEPAKGAFFMITGTLGFVTACVVWYVGTYILEWESTAQAVIWIAIVTGVLELFGLLRILIDKRPFEMFETPYEPTQKNKETA
jgi:hypothetical protein